MESFVEAIIVIVDIRGFTLLSEKRKENEQMPRFLYAFFEELVKSIESASIRESDFHVKPLGDGALIIVDWNNAPVVTLERVFCFIHDFEKSRIFGVQEELNYKYGTRFDVQLGWGITKGRVTLLGK